MNDHIGSAYLITVTGYKNYPGARRFLFLAHGKGQIRFERRQRAAGRSVTRQLVNLTARGAR